MLYQGTVQFDVAGTALVPCGTPVANPPPAFRVEVPEIPPAWMGMLPPGGNSGMWQYTPTPVVTVRSLSRQMQPPPGISEWKLSLSGPPNATCVVVVYEA